MNELERFLVHGSYLIASALFIVGLRRLGKVRTARSGNAYAAFGMLIAVLATLVASRVVGLSWIIGGLVVGGAIGAFLARWVEMTSMPELVAVFNGFGGGASAAVALAFMFQIPFGATGRLGDHVDWHVLLVVMLSILIGVVTLTGSVVAWGKLSGKISGNSILLPGRHLINILLLAASVAVAFLSSSYMVGADQITVAMGVIVVIAGLLGVLLVIPIGGADMPVVISLLNSYSGLAASMAGFALLVRGEPSAYMLIISGALVGASGLILTNLMCKAMNRSLISVLVGGFGEGAASEESSEYSGVKSFSAEEAAMILDGAELIIIVPGYGLAVAQAQQALAELDELLSSRGSDVRYAIHPVAGRMPGHMNVLLAEANVPYEKLYDLDDINSEFKDSQACIVVGANDVVNPAAIEDPKSVIAGMPILNAHESQNVIVVKRSLSAGYAGIKNSLFERDQTMMLFADAKKACLDMAKELSNL